MQFLIFTGGEKNDLFDLLFSDLSGLPQVSLHSELPRIPAKLQKLWTLHHAPGLNERRPLPFRNGWSRYASLYNYTWDEKEDYCLIFSNISIGFYEPGFLNLLKKKHGVRLVLYLLDSYDSYYSKQARIARGQIDFDRVYTFHKTDAEEYGMDFFDTYYSCLSIEENKSSPGAFFWGSDSGRGPMAEQIHEVLTAGGIPADFGICYSDPLRTKREGIIYDMPLPYLKMLSRMSAKDCIVDIVGEYSKGISLRPYEAVVYGKKLLSNNPMVKTMRFYNPEYMQIFDDPGEIDLDFLRSSGEAEYGYHNEYSPVVWIKRLENELK